MPFREKMICDPPLNLLIVKNLSILHRGLENSN